MGSTTKIQARRSILRKIISAGAVATVLPTSWLKPVVKSVLLPAHAQASIESNLLEYFEVLQTDNAQPFPRVMSAIVDPDTGIASVIALNRVANVRPEIDLNIDGTPSNAFSGTIGSSCGGSSLPSASWFVNGYTLGDPTISITTTSPAEWTLVLPLATGTVPATCL